MIKKKLALLLAMLLNGIGFISKKDYENYKFNLKFFTIIFISFLFLLSINGVSAVGTMINCSADPSIVVCYHFNNDSTVGENYSSPYNNITYDYSSYHANNGTHFGITSLYNTTGGYLRNGAFEFNTTSNYIKTLNMSTKIGDNKAFTISFWVKSNNQTGRKLFSSLEAGLLGRFRFSTNSVNPQSIDFNIGNWTGSLSNIILPYTWYKLDITYDGSTNAVIYRNGEIFATNTTMVNFIMSPNLLVIGASDSGTFVWNGSIDEFIVHNKSLNYQQIRNNFYINVRNDSLLNSTGYNCSKDSSIILCYHFSNDSKAIDYPIYNYIHDYSSYKYYNTLFDNITMNVSNGISGDGLTWNSEVKSYVNTSLNINRTLNNYSISFWVKSYGTLQRYIYSADTLGNDSFLSRVDDTRDEQIDIVMGGVASGIDNTLPKYNWTNFIITYNDIKYVVYKNGILLDTGTGFVRNLTFKDLIIGSTPDLTYNWNGSIDEFIVYNKTISSPEALILYDTVANSGIYDSTNNCFNPFDDFIIDGVVNICSNKIYSINDSSANYIFRVLGSNSVLNCNNSLFLGNGSSRGISTSNNNNLSIMNCMFRDYTTGISISSTDSSIFKNISIYNSYIPFAISDSNNSIYEYNYLEKTNFTFRISTNSNNNTFRYNYFNNSLSLTDRSISAESFYFIGGYNNYNRIINNTFYESEGIFLRGNNFLIDNNTFQGNYRWNRLDISNNNNSIISNNIFINNFKQQMISSSEIVSCINLTIRDNLFSNFSHAIKLFNISYLYIYNNTFSNATTGYDGWNVGIDLSVGNENVTIRQNVFSDMGNAGIILVKNNNVLIINNSFDYMSLDRKLSLKNIGGVLDEVEPLCAIFNYQLYKSYLDINKYYTCGASCLDSYDELSQYVSNNITILNNNFGSNVQCFFRNQGGTNIAHDLTGYRYFSWQLPALLKNDEFFISNTQQNLSNINHTVTSEIYNYYFKQGYNGQPKILYSWSKDYEYYKNINLTQIYQVNYLKNNSIFYLTQNNTLKRTDSLNQQLNYTLNPNGELYVFNWSNYSNYVWNNALIFYPNFTVQNGSYLINGLYNVKFNDSNNLTYAINNYILTENTTRPNEPFNITSTSDNSVYHKWSISSLITTNITIPVNLSFYNCSRLSYVMIVPKGQNPYLELNYTCNNNRLIIPRVNMSYSITSDEIYAFYAYASLAELYQTYNAEVLSGSYQTYQLVLSYNATAVNIVKGEINYNGTIHNSTMYLMPTSALFISSFNVPVVSSRVNTTFFWNISISNSTFSTYFNSSTKTQSIIPDVMHWCDYEIYNVTFLNFTTKNWLNEELLNTTFKITYSYNNQTMDYYDSSEDNYSYPFCFEPPDKNYVVDAMVEYDATGYAKNYYYLYQANLTNVTQNIDLYLLNNSYATLTKLKVYDESHKNLQNVIVTTQAYDVGTNTYKTVAMSKTDYLGEDITYLNWYNTFYKFILSRNGEIVYVSNITKITETPKNFQVNLKTFFNFDKFKDIIYTLSFNNATGNFVLTYILPSGKVTSTCLRVVKRTLKNDTTICDVCETSMSATLYCNINAYGNGTYLGYFYATGSLGYIDGLIQLVGYSNTIFNLLGEVDASMYAFLFALVVVVMFMLTPVLGIIGIILGVLGAMLMGFQPLNYMEFLGITLVGGIIIWMLKR